MKKMMKLLGLFAMAALLFSCEKANRDIIDPTPIDQTDPNEAPSATDGKLLTSFGVTFEADTKVSVDLDGGTTAIENGDKVLVFVDNTNNAIYKYNGSEFVLEDGETAVSLDAPASVFYPADEFEANGTYVNFTMPNGVVADGAVFGRINPMAGVITENAGAYSVELCNIASVLRVKVAADVNINSVTLDYGTDVKYAAGAKFTVDADLKTMTAAGVSSETSETVELSSPATSADILFVIPTLSLDNGLSVTANLASNHNGGANSFTVTNTSTAARERNKISTMSFKAKLFDGGLGTSESPYLIASAKDFKYIQKYTTEGYTPGSKSSTSFLSAHYRQTEDINAGSVTPIGTSSNPFMGVYDGNDKTLNVNISSLTDNTGVFGQIKGATIQNMKVEGSITSSGENTGGIVGRIQSGQIINCTNSATVQGATAVGGITGRFDNLNTIEVRGCKNTGNIKGSGVRIGGIVGFMGNGIVESCCNTGNVTSNDNSSFSSMAATGSGGIAGDMRGGTVNLCYSSDNAKITSFVQAGGLVGVMYGSNGDCLLINCAAKSEVQSTQPNNSNGRGHAGGLVGTMTVTSSGKFVIVANSVAYDAKIYGYFSDANVGGIVGRINCASTGLEENAIVRNCYYQGKNTKIGYSTNSGSSITASTNTGGVFGFAGSDPKVGVISDSYCHTTITKTGVGGKTTINVQKLADNVINGNNSASFGPYYSGKAQENVNLLVAMQRGSWGSSSGYGSGFSYTSSASTVNAKYWDWKDTNSHPTPRNINYGN